MDHIKEYYKLKGKSRDIDYKAGMLLEELANSKLALTDRGYTWAKGKGNGALSGDWDFVSKTKRIDIKGCEASKFNGNMFPIEVRTLKGYTTWWNCKKGDSLIYIDTHNVTYWILNCIALKAVCETVMANGCKLENWSTSNTWGLTITLDYLKECGVIKQFDVK